MVRRLRAAEAGARLASQFKAYTRPALLIVDLCRPRDYAEGSSLPGLIGRDDAGVLGRLAGAGVGIVPG